MQTHITHTLTRHTLKGLFRFYFSKNKAILSRIAGKLYQKKPTNRTSELFKNLETHGGTETSRKHKNTDDSIEVNLFTVESVDVVRQSELLQQTIDCHHIIAR